MSFLSRYREYRERGVRTDVRILLLAILFFVLGLVFFYMRAGHPAESDLIPLVVLPTDEVVPERVPTLASYPDPETYDSFVYGEDMEALPLEVSCSDTYYTVLLFSVRTDYRVDPLDAKYNTATPCVTSGTQMVAIPLSGISLVHGERYYSVRAAQGTKGGWYNPY